MATKTLRVFAEYTSTGFVPMPTAGNIDYGFTLGTTFPATTPATYQTDNPDLVVTVTAMTDFYVWIRVNGQAWNPSYTRNVRVYPDSPNINNVVMNMIIATGPAGVSSYTQIVQTSNRLYFNGATTDSIYNSKFAGKTYINELNFGTAPGLATVATSGAYADLTGKPTLATVATSGLFTDLSSKPSGTAPLSYNSGTNSFVITQANTSTNGYLSSTDWNTFNNKFATPAGTTLQYVDGTGALQTFPVLASADKLVINVRNSSGVSMPKGSVVYINGATGNKPTVALSQGNSNATSAQTLGLLQTTLANNAEGNVVIVGAVTDLNTSAFSEGQQLYLSPTTAGACTSTKQYAPNHLVYVGVVTRSHVSLGTIEVKVQNGYEMDELHNVSAQSPSNNDGLFYNTTTSLWEKKSIATVLGYTPYNGTDTSIKALFSATTPLSYSNGVYGISQATTASNGYLSSTDWNTFNGKTSLNGTGFVKVTGTTISYDNTSYLPLSGGLMTGSIQFSDTTNLKRGIYGSMGTDDNWFVGANAGGVSQGYLEIATGDDGTEPIYATQYTGDAFTTGTVARRVKILDESGNSIFPNTLTATTLVKSGGTSSQFLKADGSIDTSVYLTTASASSTYQTILTNPITGTGTINYIPKFTSSSAIGNSIIFDNGTSVGIGTSSPVTNIQVSGSNGVTDSYGQLFIQTTNSSTADYGGQLSLGGYYLGTSNSTAFGAIAGRKENGTSGSALGYLSFSTQNGTITERMRISSAGNVGIGTSSPTGKFSVNTGASNQIAFFNNSTSGGTYNIISLNGSYSEGTNMSIQGGGVGDANLYVNSGYTSSTSGAIVFRTGSATVYTERMLITSMGNISFNGGNTTTGNPTTAPKNFRFNNDYSSGTTDASLKIYLFNQGSTIQGFTSGPGYDLQYHTSGSSLGKHVFYVQNSAIMTIGSSNILMGTTTDNGERLYVSGAIRATGNITANSDLTLKKNLTIIDNPIDKLMQLNGYAYQWKANDEYQYGVIAQEVEKVLPYAVQTGNDKIKGVAYNQLTPLLIEGFKSHESEITQLKKRIKIQQAEIDILKSKLA
jgi:hypothetical protein